MGGRRRAALTAAIVAIATATATATATASTAPTVQDWPQYLHDATHTGATQDNALTASNSTALTTRTGWPAKFGGGISTQPVVANGLVYSGSWDGNEYALNANGTVAWKTALGVTTPASSSCGSPAGVASTGAVATVTIGSDPSASSVLYVGGGGNNAAGGGKAFLAALDAKTGTIRWKTALGTAPATFIWASPLVLTPPGAATPSVYIGVSSYGDCPLVQAMLVQLDARTGTIQHQFAVVPTGCVGGSIWGSPTFDPTDGSLYFATGNPGTCRSAAEPYANAVVKVRASDLTLLSYWQVPAAEVPGDSDFGDTPTLFTGTVTPTGASRSLVGVGNKNGVFYVLDRTKLSAGPVARVTISVAGDCPQCGDGVIAPAAYDGTTVYVGGGQPTSGSSYNGVLRALNPNNLAAPRWIHNTGEPILGAVTEAPGIVVVAEGNYILLINPSTGATLARYYKGMGTLYGAPSISHGVLYEGDMNGALWAYSVNGA